MKTRKAVALALMGWYLMVPPGVWPTYRLGSSAPISRWDIIQRFDTAAECEGYLQKQKEKTGPLSAKFKTAGDMTWPQMMAAHCVFSDDPGLAK
jgi:hypothetical protein